MGAWERLWQPRWGGGWALSRVLFGAAALYEQWNRLRQLRDALRYPDIVFSTGFTHIADHALIRAGGAYALWGLGLLGLAGLFYGGRVAKPGLAVWFLTYIGLLAALGLESRVPTRMISMVALGLWMGPIGARELTRASVTPWPRWYFLVLFGALYGSTGWLKLLAESSWHDGSALAYDLVDLNFGLQPLGVWASAHPPVTWLASWWTMLFEAAFPLLVISRRTNPFVLVAGACMHIGIEILMEVNTLSYTCLSMYPVLLHPDVARSLYRRLHRAPPEPGPALPSG